MMVEQLSLRINDVVNQLEHAMFLSGEGRLRLERELHELVEARDKARAAVKIAQSKGGGPRRAATWGKKVY